MSDTENILSRPGLSPNVVNYHVLSLVAMLTVSVVGIVLIPFAAPIAYAYYRRYYARLEVKLTSRELQVNRGILVREEKSIPLEKITDLATLQGPVMRYMGLKGLAIETAGQSGGDGALVRLIGLEDTEAFRALALKQRDRVTDRKSESGGRSTSAESDTSKLLTEIRDTLIRLESKLP